MVEGKPYRYGLIVTGLCVVAVGLFIMMQERPHIYVTVCFLGATMVCVGTVWSLCQCYPKVIVTPVLQRESLEDLLYSAAEAKDERSAEALPGFCDRKLSGGVVDPEATKNQCHSCPTLHLA
ncbi:barttin [Nematolebias whitei]|uniref:barttin n=1 Tax=Nematolebias whitei TaxID=451745 RepID=UPI00189BA92E|nr:barttin [Nematolebias whitei]